MKLTKFETATKIYEHVKELDKQIIELDRIAISIANGGNQINLILKVRDTEKEAKQKVKISFDSDGSLINGEQPRMYTGIFGYIMGGDISKPKEDEFTEKLNNEITDSSALQIIGVLLADKVAKRKVFIEQLQRIGLEI